MKFRIESKKESIFFILILSVISTVAALWLPIDDWGAVKKMSMGFLGGIFMGLIIMTSRFIGAFDDNPDK